MCILAKSAQTRQVCSVATENERSDHQQGQERQNSSLSSGAAPPTFAASAVNVGFARLYRFPVEYWEMARSLAHPDSAFTNPSCP